MSSSAGSARVAWALSISVATPPGGGSPSTIAYTAPERFEADAGSTVTAAADIFAWGVVVAHAATGRAPFGGNSAPSTAMRILTQPPDLTGITGPLRDLIERALVEGPPRSAVPRQAPKPRPCPCPCPCPEVEVDNLPDNCLQSTLVTVDWPDGSP